MPLLTIRAQLEYEIFNGPTFGMFLPLRSTAQWRQLGKTRFEVRVYVDPEKHRGWISDIDLEQIEKYANVSSTGAFIELRSSIGDDLAVLLSKQGNASPDSHDFATEVLDALRRVHRTFIAFVRDDGMQYSLRRWENHRLSERVDQRLAGYDARWELPEGGRWKSLHPQCPLCLSSQPIIIRSTTGLTKQVWSAFEDALQRGGHRAKPHRRLLANAFAHYDNDDMRAAIIEAVAAWETVLLGGLVASRLSENRVQLEDSKWKALFRKTGLRSGTQLAIALRPDLFEPHAATLDEAIGCRTDVVHGGAVRLDREKIARRLWAIRSVIEKCESGPA